MSDKIALACEICGRRNYSTKKNRLKTERLSLKKYCKHCGGHTVHWETR